MLTMFHIQISLQHWDGTGGNGSALRHFEATGKKYPLVVKLGTITPAGADVYSYAEDEEDMVLDSKLPQHLTHWGINVLQVSILSWPSLMEIKPNLFVRPNH